MSVVIKGIVIANSPAILARRVQTLAGSYLVNADVTSIVVKVYNEFTSVLVATLDSSAWTIHDTLQTDAIWQGEDAIGYNLAIAIPGSAWPVEGTYRVQALVTPVAGSAFEMLWDCQAVKTY